MQATSSVASPNRTDSALCIGHVVEAHLPYQRSRPDPGRQYSCSMHRLGLAATFLFLVEVDAAAAVQSARADMPQPGKRGAEQIEVVEGSPALQLASTRACSRSAWSHLGVRRSGAVAKLRRLTQQGVLSHVPPGGCAHTSTAHHLKDVHCTGCSALCPTRSM